MTIDELIKELETADRLAPNEELDYMPPAHDGKPWLAVGKCWVIGPSDAEGLDADDLQAIAIRHNTAGDVLRYLRDAHWTNCANHAYGESQERLAELVKTERTRAEQAEAEVARLKAEQS